MSHIHAVVEKVAQDVVQGAGPMLRRQDQGDLIGCRYLFPISGNDEKAGVVLGIVIDRFSQYVQAVQRSCLPIGNGSDRESFILRTFSALSDVLK